MSHTCTCIRLDCWHAKGQCDEPPVIRGGICTTCRFYRKPVEDEWMRGDWMQTYTGRRFPPEDPKPSDIDPVDIAHSLSLLCRYAGHVSKFYSVAEHCILMSEAVSPENALAALLHDATEAYVVDLPRPVKRLLPEYQALEGRVWDAIAARFEVDTVIPPEVHEADTRILLTEKALLLPHSEERWPGLDGIEPLPVVITPMAPKRAERIYRARLEELLS